MPCGGRWTRRARLKPFDSSAFFVTGAASGLGEATARMIVDAGGSVIVADVNDASGARVAAALGTAARFSHVDVTDEDSVGQALAAAGTMGTLRGVVNAAGVV